ncbi:MAG: hypothetical protein N3D20_00920 [Candidatus Pacearchaeota archaeon]|nr:hypothetical protein [Candidatus Pacearchaeota archaeon]
MQLSIIIVLFVLASVSPVLAVSFAYESTSISCIEGSSRNGITKQLTKTDLSFENTALVDTPSAAKPEETNALKKLADDDVIKALKPFEDLFKKHRKNLQEHFGDVLSLFSCLFYFI